MGKIKIFLASSSELKDDRVEFELYIGRKNKEWHDKDVFLELIIWEDFLDAMSQTRLQDEYNKAIRECDIFVMLFFSKVGKYTNEEFETAFGQFKKTNRPLIYTYFKNLTKSTGCMNPEDKKSLDAFIAKLGSLGHFYTNYKNIDNLKLKFERQLDKLADSGFIQLRDSRIGLPVKPFPKPNGVKSVNYRELIDVEEIVDFDQLLTSFKQMISGENSKKIMFIVARDGRGKTSLLRKMGHHCQSQKMPCCLLDLTETYDFPHLELAREIRESLEIPMADVKEASALASAPGERSGEILQPSTEIGGSSVTSSIETRNIIQIVLNNEALQSEDMRRRLTRDLLSDISSAKKMMVCLFDTFDAGTRVVKDWIIDALLRPIREGSLKNLVIVIAGSAWPQISDLEWETHTEFIEGMPLMSKNHLLEFAERIGCELSPVELDVCWQRCGGGKPLLMNTIVKTLCQAERSNG